MAQDILTISQITHRVTSILEGDSELRNIWIQGEVGNFTRASSGHLYFGLKDAQSQISCVMWKSAAVRQQWLPEVGDEIQVRGRISVYRTRGVYQFQASELVPAGRGSLYAQFEMLKAQFEREGLFRAERKRPIPAFPRRLGIVTSAEADALQDVLRTLRQRWNDTHVVLFHSLVQGAEAPFHLERAFAQAEEYHGSVHPLDALLLVRGGGSLEDLWAFNDERVVYAVHRSSMPVITGVGHETDTTLVDFVADLRAPTPTGAAVAAVPDGEEIAQGLGNLTFRLQGQVLGLLNWHRDRLAQQDVRLRNAHPVRVLQQRGQDLDGLEARLQRAMSALMRQRKADLHNATGRLGSLSPFRVLERGYSMIRKEDGKVVTEPNQTVAGERLQVHSQGGIYAVERIGESEAD